MSSTRSNRSGIRRGALLGAATVVTIAFAVAGCGSPAGSATVASTPTGGSAPAPAASSPAPEVVTIQASEWAFTITGSPHAGLVEIHASNLGAVSHEFGLVRVKDGVTLAQVKKALAKGEDAARALQAAPDTEITTAGIAGPRVNQHVVVPLVAGHYVVTSFLPDSGGRSQVDRGMIGEFTVLAADARAAAPPTTSGTVTLSDSSIALPDGFAKGGTFEVTNAGTKPHDFSVAQLEDEPLPAYFQCVGQSYGAGTPIDRCPGVLQGGVTTLQPGASAYVTMVFGAGEFGYVSTQGDGADFQAGLNGTFRNP